MRNHCKLLPVFLFVLSLPLCSYGQKFAVKTNALYWGGLAPNLGIEFRAGDKSTFDVSGAYNPFSFSDTKTYKFWLVQPEYRFWFCEGFNGTFLGLHVHGGEFNVGYIKMPFGLLPGLKDHRYDGYYYGAGLSVGRQWIISRRWSFEASLGVGYARIEFDKYRCDNCSPLVKSDYKNYFGPTKASFSFIFFIK